MAFKGNQTSKRSRKVLLLSVCIRFSAGSESFPFHSVTTGWSSLQQPADKLKSHLGDWVFGCVQLGVTGVCRRASQAEKAEHPLWGYSHFLISRYELLLLCLLEPTAELLVLDQIPPELPLCVSKRRTAHLNQRFWQEECILSFRVHVRRGKLTHCTRVRLMTSCLQIIAKLLPMILEPARATISWVQLKKKDQTCSGSEQGGGLVHHSTDVVS